VLHIAERSEALMPRDPAGLARATCWVVAALNRIEPMIMELANIDIFNADAEWARLRRPGAEKKVRERLGRLSAWLGERDHLEDRFTAGDLMMATMLRILHHTDLVAEHPNLARYQARCEARPAFRRAGGAARTIRKARSRRGGLSGSPIQKGDRIDAAPDRLSG
jgi:glutathione S-transferase